MSNFRHTRCTIIREIFNWAASARTLKCVALAGLVFRVVSRIFCSRFRGERRTGAPTLFEFVKAFDSPLAESRPCRQNKSDGTSRFAARWNSSTSLG
jgi:hypothetical protein